MTRGGDLPSILSHDGAATGPKRALIPAGDALFTIVFAALTVLCAVPFWLTRLLPMQDYPHFLVFVRAFSDYRDPASPFHGTYTTGFPLSPLVLPLLLLRALAAVSSIETAGRLLWTLYAVGLPIAALHLLTVLRRDRWAVLLVFPLVISYWVIGGFFAFATATPLLLLGLALAVRWLEARSWRHGLALAAVLCALHLWHALVFAQLLLDFGILWLLHRAHGPRDRLRALAPILPALVLFAVWMVDAVHGRPPGARPAIWPPFFDNAARFFDFIGPIVPGASGAAALLAVIVLIGALTRSRRPPLHMAFRVESPFAWLAAASVFGFLVLPSICFSVEGIHNRQPWLAALLFVFAWSLPARPAPRALVLALTGGAAALTLLHLAGRFAAFGRETAGASRLLDRVGPGQTLLAPIAPGSTLAFPGKPLIALDLYASVRHGGLPNSSFAGYHINFIRFVDDKNPMPQIGRAWLDHPELTKFDYVLLRGPAAAAAKSARPGALRPIAEDGEWTLLAVCGGRALQRC